MITVNQGRAPSPRRVQTPSNKTPSAQSKTFAPPIGGLVTNAQLALQRENTAVLAENFWPTKTGLEPRGGTQLRCTTAGAVEALFEYNAGSTPEFFAADSGNIYDWSESTVSGTSLTPVVTGQSGADYSTLVKQTDAGVYLTVVNGQDDLQIYDGASWQAVTDVSSPFSITGVDTDVLTHVWAYRNRTFFIEAGTMNAWYLGVNSVAGAATKLPLSGVFNKGGVLLFGATWSSDSGSGMDDRCVFATDQGEFAVYSGGNPGDANDWSLNGVYNIGRPLGKNAHIQVGGDLIVATKAGLIPMSAAVQKDQSQLKLSALSQAIDPDWRRETVLSGEASGWDLVKWDSRNMAVVAPPLLTTSVGFCWPANLETGAWTKFTGWNVSALAVLNDRLYYGNGDGTIYLCDVGGLDDEQAFECRVCFAFDHLGAPGAYKTAHAIKGTWSYTQPFNAKHTIASDYNPAFGTAPSAATGASTSGAQWDVALWDVTYWGSQDSSYAIREKWESVSGHGEVLAPQIQVTSAQDYKLDCELIAVDLLYSTGGVLT